MTEVIGTSDKKDLNKYTSTMEFNFEEKGYRKSTIFKSINQSQRPINQNKMYAVITEFPDMFSIYYNHRHYHRHKIGTVELI